LLLLLFLIFDFWIFRLFVLPQFEKAHGPQIIDGTGQPEENATTKHEMVLINNAKNRVGF